MSLYKADGKLGLLAKGIFGTQSANIPDYSDQIAKLSDPKLLAGQVNHFHFHCS
jgi:hypothetical protein